MKTWRKIEDTRKRTNEIVTLKNRNEERIQKVNKQVMLIFVENLRFPIDEWAVTAAVHSELHGEQVERWGEKKSAGGYFPV